MALGQNLFIFERSSHNLPKRNLNIEVSVAPDPSNTGRSQSAKEEFKL